MTATVETIDGLEYDALQHAVVETAEPVDPAEPLDAGESVEAAVRPGGVVLRIGESRYAVDMAAVAEVLPVPATTRIPGVPGWLVGVANWRGRVLPVVDLRPLLGSPTTPSPPSARLVVLGRDDATVGLLADAVPGVLLDVVGEAVAAPPTLNPDAAALVSAQVADRFGPVALLDVDAVLALRRALPRPRRTS